MGFISSLSRHFCSECNRLRLTADGCARACSRTTSTTCALRCAPETTRRCAPCSPRLWGEARQHHDKVGTERSMSQIGG
ncbi:MAG: hypothetical protein ACLTMP_02600 [Eggerthella lenta]